ncbi:MAG: CBS domain-containing protein [Proteobacteria bacterium]|nr:CBS domain-containing protein [Pseudomonadota bacterium]
MAIIGNAMPLISLDALVIDTETTGLDPAKARVIEIGAICLEGGKLVEASAWRQLVNPGGPIPEASTRVHHIDDGMVADAPRFAGAWPGLAERMDGAVVIGHTVGFDLAVLKHECQRAGLNWQQPRILDTNLLAQVVEPRLGGYSLEHLASWLNVPLADRHAALGDAITTARIFLALLHKLRDGRIRTLAEAENACLAFTSVLEEQHRAGWEEAVAPRRQRVDSALGRIDTYPYRHRIADVMSTPVKTVAALAPLSQALDIMARGKISSLLMTPAGNDSNTPLPVASTAIITERDVMRAMSERGAAALDIPVATFASRPVIALPSTAFVYRALGRMSRHKLRHLVVEDDEGHVCGIVSSRDLLRLRAQEAVILGDAVDGADDVPELAAAWAPLPRVAEGLLAEGVGGREIAAVISRELGALTRRAGVLAERRMRADGKGGPPCPYALCVLGSAGRGESLLAMDQDNAIVFAEGEPGGAADQWFAAFGAIVADTLHDAGVPYCSGGVMAKNVAWRGSVDTWRERLASWVTRSRPEDLLAVDIFYDLLAVHGDARLANGIWRAGFDMAEGHVAFVKLLAKAGGAAPQSFTLLGGIRTEGGRIDLKRAGLFGIVTLARVLAVRHHLVERGTAARLRAAIGALARSVADLEALTDAQSTFLDLILRQQLADLHAGLPPGNKVEVKPLSRRDRERLSRALDAVRYLDRLTEDLLY